MLLYNRNKFNIGLQNDLCIGCGLCETIGNKDGYTMILSENGFYKPKCVTHRSIIFEKKISKICPGINLKCPKSKDNIWGNINGLYNAWSNDSEVRKKGSSGGVISALCIYMLENKIIDGILHVGKTDDHFMYNQLFISKTRNEVLLNASSRYAPAKVFNRLTSILENTNETYAFVGKPCDIAGLKNYLIYNPHFQNRIKYFLSFFCAGIPSYNATLKLLEQSKQKELPYFLKYRGDGWPGFFEAKYKNGEVYKVSYQESWGEILGRYVHFRCKICPDGIGLMADIVFGDSWETKDGYPNFEERDGKSLIITRTVTGNSLINDACKNDVISIEPLEKHKIERIQPYQYERRLMVGYRIFVIQFLTLFLLNFKNTGYLKSMTKYPIIKGLRNSIGTLKRYILKSKN